MKTAAILPALGIGDGILMMIASHQLMLRGYQVITYHNQLGELSSWFQGHAIEKIPASFETALSEVDLIIVENDNSEKMHALRKNERACIFYPTYSETKHGPLRPNDKVFNPDLPMAENCARAIASLLSFSPPSKDNGIAPPEPLTHRRYSNQVLIHPTSRDTAKNWHPRHFLSLARALRKRDFSPVFCVGPQEREEWTSVEREGFTLARIPHLEDLAELIYESAYVIGNDSLIGHLASNLEVPTLIIANDEKRMRLWRPGWLAGSLALPPSWLPNFKFCRTRWKDFITPRKVQRQFRSLSQSLLATDPQ